jgi:hypothetical protein
VPSLGNGVSRDVADGWVGDFLGGLPGSPSDPLPVTLSALVALINSHLDVEEGVARWSLGLGRISQARVVVDTRNGRRVVAATRCCQYLITSVTHRY